MNRAQAWACSVVLVLVLACIIWTAVAMDRGLNRQEGAVERLLNTPIHFDGEDFYASEALDALCQDGRCRWHKDRGRIVIEPEGQP